METDSPTPSMNAENESPLIIALDYGASSTKAAWARFVPNTSLELNDIHVVREWTGDTGGNPFVPSSYAYSSEGPSKWGYGAASDPAAIHRTKAELDVATASEGMGRLSELLKILADLNADPTAPAPINTTERPEKVAANYLKEVLACVRDSIGRAGGSDALSRSALDFVVTHPASWGYDTKNNIYRTVSTLIGELFPSNPPDRCRRTVHLMLESEAGAQFSFLSTNLRRGYDLREGQCLLFMDAGASKMEMSAYLVREASPTLKLQRVTEVSCEPYGSFSIDNTFYDRFVLNPGNKGDIVSVGPPGTDPENTTTTLPGSRLHSKIQNASLRHFEVLKHGLRNDVSAEASNLTTIVRVPSGGNEGDVDVHLTNQEIMDLFDPVCNGAMRLIKEQLSKLKEHYLRPEALFVGGGLSRNEYFFSRVQDMVQQRKFTAVRLEDSWSAVTQGAILLAALNHTDTQGLSTSTATACTQSPFHIGIVLSDEFDPDRHLATQRYNDTLYGTSRAKDCVQWVVHKGDMVSTSDITCRNTTILRRLTQFSRLSGTVKVIVAKADDADTLERYSETDPGLEILDVEYSIEGIPSSLHQSFHSETRVPYSKVELQVEFSLEHEKIAVEVYFEDSNLIPLFGGLGERTPKRYTLGRISTSTG
ncbi:hypothetical protein B0T16DRAFT_419768 [Cercophora newfieldiana]|uniref:Actin-like ATPase domain-containing protein n=1 Tax=Cercophora newfieldiana TaxID=92897 RepID=A0AA39XXI0_9PEZI|nr:hypothetical protein B0T16DRAFT_419768 [Cercophora newfieldiana]